MKINLKEKKRFIHVVVRLLLTILLILLQLIRFLVSLAQPSTNHNLVKRRLVPLMLKDAASSSKSKISSYYEVNESNYSLNLYLLVGQCLIILSFRGITYTRWKNESNPRLDPRFMKSILRISTKMYRLLKRMVQMIVTVP